MSRFPHSRELEPTDGMERTRAVPAVFVVFEPLADAVRIRDDPGVTHSDPVTVRERPEGCRVGVAVPLAEPVKLVLKSLDALRLAVVTRDEKLCSFEETLRRISAGASCTGVYSQPVGSSVV